MVGGDVDTDWERGEGGAGQTADRQLVEEVVGQLVDEAELLDDLEERARDPDPVGVDPADQGLRPDDRPGLEVDEGLEIRDQLAPAER